MITFERTAIFYLCDGNLALHEFFYIYDNRKRMNVQNSGC
jgi:hypothetical protein